MNDNKYHSKNDNNHTKNNTENKKDHKKEKVIIYTDGACRGNPGLGAWAAVLTYKNIYLEIGESVENSTNNKMELTAIIKALTKITKKSEVVLYTDSSYVVNGITKWITGWIKKGWKKADKSEVLNKELWTELYELTKKHQVDFNWVKGHSGVPLNERVDKIANILMDEHKKTGNPQKHIKRMKRIFT